VPALVVGVVCLLALARPAVAQAPLLTNGTFEEGLTGWGVAGEVTASADLSTGGFDGPTVARVTADGPGVHQFRSLWWTGGPVAPGAAYQLEARVLDDDPGVSVSMALEFLDSNGGRLNFDDRSNPTVDVISFQHLLVQGVAPAGSAFARAVFEASFDGAGSSFAVDAVMLQQVAEPPAVAPTVAPPPPPPPVSTAAPVTTPRPTATPRATATPRPTATPTPPPRPLGPTLVTRAPDGVTPAWEAVRGAVAPSPARDGLFVLRSESASTAWMEQAVTVQPGAWYQAGAVLTPVGGVRAAWVRIAWYASPDATGPQMETDDSTIVTVDGVAIVIEPLSGVTTGPVRAPDEALSAKVRILLQPAISAGAALAVEDVRFLPSGPPAPSPTPTPQPSETPLPTTSATPSPEDGPAPAGSSSSSDGDSGSSAESGDPIQPPISAAQLSAQQGVRITELLPDPVQPGRDADFEWVELTNLGQGAVHLAGMAIRDGHASTALPGVVIPPGASVVVAGQFAEVDADVRLSGSIGNGLGNEGDELELLDASGQIVDRLEYGVGTDLVVSPGEAIHVWFDGAGVLMGADVGTPSPGLHAPVVRGSAEEIAGLISEVVADTEEASSGAVAASSRPVDEPDTLAWVLLLALGAGALGGAMMQRLGRWASTRSREM